MRDELYIMRDEKVPKALVSMAVPAIAASLVTIVFNIIDTYFISLLNNPAMIAATTVGLPLTMVIQSFGEGIAVGSGSYISKLLGQKKNKEAYEALATSMTLTFLIGGTCSLIFLVFLNELLPLFNIADDVIVYSYEYMFIILLGGIGIISKSVFTYLLRSQGLMKTPTRAIMIGIILNLALDPFLMFQCNLQIKGAALATTIAELTTSGLMLYKILNKDSLLSWSFKDLYIKKDALDNIVSIGSAAFIRNVLPSFSMTFLIRAAGMFSTALVAAVGIAKKSLRLITGVYSGYSHGIQPFTAYNYGARDPDRINEALRLSRIFVLSAGFFTSFIFFFYGDHVVSLYVRDPEIMYYSSMMLKGYALSLPVLGIYHVYATTLQAFGLSKRSFILSVSRQGLFYIPIVLILPPLINELGIYLAQPLSDWMTFFLMLYLCKDLHSMIASLKEE